MTDSNTDQQTPDPQDQPTPGDTLATDDLTTARMTHWAQNTRLVPAATILLKVLAAGVAVRAFLLALLIPGYAPEPLAWLGDRLGVDASALSGKGWPVIEFIGRVVGDTAAAAVVFGLILGASLLLVLRKGYVLSLVRLFHRP
jgi:hypothetical protein